MKYNIINHIIGKGVLSKRYLSQFPRNVDCGRSCTSFLKQPFGERAYFKFSIKDVVDLDEVNKRPLYPPPPTSGKSLVVVESASKAKVIQGYLGEMFKVVPSYGHVRDLGATVKPEFDDDDLSSMVWEVPCAAWTRLETIKLALATRTENLILASDPDCEGEALAWHIIEMLQQQKALPENINIVRVVFNEITISSVREALKSPRNINLNLVHAYLARCALDYIIRFNITPLLFNIITTPLLSVGRVESVALAIICDRETEIDQFKPQEYWTIEAKFFTTRKRGYRSFSFVTSRYYDSDYDSKKITELSEMIKSSKFDVGTLYFNTYYEMAPSPYIASTLQQDSASKLQFTPVYTMKLAQKLYEGGLITYMRTDGLHMSKEVVEEIRSYVKERFGENFISNNVENNVENSQEAIRPTDIRRTPSSMLSGTLDEDCLKLYTLIWSRSISCQMKPCFTRQIQVEIHGAVDFLASSSRLEFPGFQSVYEDDTKSIDENDFENLKSLSPMDRLRLQKLQVKKHYTQHPPRYTQGSLVEKMKELGIGRPSTYATTIQALKDLNYVSVNKNDGVLYPVENGRMVSALLRDHFTELTDYSFTANMETELDNISGGVTKWKSLLEDYWTRFSQHLSVIRMEHFLFLDNQHTRCKYIAKKVYGGDASPDVEEPKVLGQHNEKVGF